MLLILDTFSDGDNSSLDIINRTLEPFTLRIPETMTTKICMNRIVFEGGPIISHRRFIQDDGVWRFTGACSGILLRDAFLSIDCGITDL